MFTIRPYHSADVDKRQNRKLIEITSKGLNIPLNENWSERWCRLPDDFATRNVCYKDIYEFQVRNDDVFVVTYPKSGTTWLQELAWLLMNNLNYDKAKQVGLFERSIFLE